jgi:hypothetical protein
MLRGMGRSRRGLCSFALAVTGALVLGCAEDLACVVKK